jgi:hypothetical protein
MHARQINLLRYHTSRVACKACCNQKSVRSLRCIGLGLDDTGSHRDGSGFLEIRDDDRLHVHCLGFSDCPPLIRPDEASRAVWAPTRQDRPEVVRSSYRYGSRAFSLAAGGGERCDDGVKVAEKRWRGTREGQRIPTLGAGSHTLFWPYIHSLHCICVHGKLPNVKSKCSYKDRGARRSLIDRRPLTRHTGAPKISQSIKEPSRPPSPPTADIRARYVGTAVRQRFPIHRVAAGSSIRRCAKEDHSPRFAPSQESPALTNRCSARPNPPPHHLARSLPNDTTSSIRLEQRIHQSRPGLLGAVNKLELVAQTTLSLLPNSFLPLSFATALFCDRDVQLPSIRRTVSFRSRAD